MKKIITVFIFAVFPAWALAAGPSVKLDKAQVDLSNQASLQNGAKLFVNYCLSCHSAAFMRYNRMGEDLGLTEEQVTKNLMFSADFSKSKQGEPQKIGSLMKVAIRDNDARRWFGTDAPDLSVIARTRTPDWLYTYLRSFYLDASRPFGVNNSTFKDVAMPHVLWDLQGLKKPIFETHTDEHGEEVQEIVGYEVVIPGKMSEVEYDNAIQDLVNFLVYLGEPAKLERYNIGILVLLFLVLLFFVSYAMKKEYWKDVH